MDVRGITLDASQMLKVAVALIFGVGMIAGAFLMFLARIVFATERL